MTELPPRALVPAQAPAGRMAAGGLGRIALAGCLLGLAALLVTTAGGGGLRGALGPLFGYHSGHAARATTANPRDPSVAVSALPLRLPRTARAQARAPAGRHDSRGHRQGRSRQPRSPSRAPAPATSPVPGVPAPPPPTPPPPSPSPGIVERAANAIDQVAPALPPPAQPLVHEAVGVVGQACGLLGRCP
jgi:hypothetical protein